MTESTKEAAPKYLSSDLLTLGDIATAPKSTDSVDHSAAEVREQYELLLVKHGKLSEEMIDLKFDLEASRRKNKTADILDRLIDPYAKKSFVFMVLYCSIVGLMIAASGYKWGAFSFFALDESTLNFLVGSTATAVIGLVGMVLTGIFIGARR